MKLAQKATLLLLIAAMLLPTLISCGDAEAQDTSANTTPVETETERPYVDDIGDDVRFDGQEVKIMTWLETVCYAEEQTGEVVNDSKYDRDISVEERLGVDIINIGESYAWATRDVYLGKIRNSVMANDGAYDIASGQYATLPGLITDGVFINMNTLPYLDFSKPYWVQQLVEETSIDGKLFLATGDITPVTIQSIWCIFYNENMRVNLGLEDPVTLVNEGKWTKDTLNTMITGVYQDTDGSQTKSIGDTFGLTLLDANHTFPFVNAFNQKITVMDENNYPVLNCNTESFINAFEYMFNMLQVNQDVMYGQMETTKPETAFAEGRSLFATQQFSAAKGFTETMEDEFRILPMPKWDEQQANYQTWLGESNSLFGIVTTTANKDATAAAMEMIAAESYRLVSPAIFEITLKTRYSVDSEMAQMFDVVREGIVFNFGLVYGFAMNSLNVFWKERLSYTTNAFTSTWASKEAGFKKAIDDFYAKITELPE